MYRKIFISVMVLAVLGAVSACESKSKGSSASSKPTGSPATSKSKSLNPVSVKNPWIRLRPPGMKVTGGFIRLINPNDVSDKLLSAASDICEATELHQMIHENNIMKMKKVDSIELPASGTLDLKPGGYHLMFINLKSPLKADQKVRVKLTFEKSGSRSVIFQVKNTMMKKPSHKMKMDHDKTPKSK